jgi:hypothetical protein
MVMPEENGAEDNKAQDQLLEELLQQSAIKANQSLPTPEGTRVELLYLGVLSVLSVMSRGILRMNHVHS